MIIFYQEKILTLNFTCFIIVTMKMNIDKIERERKRQGLTKTEMALKMGMSRQAYWDFINNGSTRLSTLTKIAEILEFDPKDLLTD